MPRRVRDPEARRTLEAWLARTGTVLSYAGWEDAGNSGAQVFAVYARRRHEGRLTDARKLVVKVLPPRASSVREPQRHARAEELSTPYFVERRLARQLPDYPPQPLGGNGWIMFQEIAGGSLTDYRSLSALMESETVGGPAIAALCGRVVESVLNEWNTPQTLGFHRGTVSDVLTGLLGPRIEEGGTLHTWARHDPGLLENPRPYLALPGESRLFPNPFALVTGPRMAGDETLSLLAGLGHGDLHPGNVVCRHRPGRAADAHRFIDLSRFSDDAPLVCDPAHFVLSIVASQLAKERAPEVRTDLARYLIDPDGHPGHDVRVGLREVIRSIHEAEKGWVENNGRGLYAEWKSHRLLAHLACALVFSGRARLRPEDRQWFFELAARAAGAYLGHQDERRTERPAGPTTVGSRGTRHIATEPGPLWCSGGPNGPPPPRVPRAPRAGTDRRRPTPRSAGTAGDHHRTARYRQVAARPRVPGPARRRVRLRRLAAGPARGTAVPGVLRPGAALRCRGRSRRRGRCRRGGSGPYGQLARRLRRRRPALGRPPPPPTTRVALHRTDHLTQPALVPDRAPAPAR